MIEQRAELFAVTIRFDALGVLEIEHAILTVDDGTGVEVAPRSFHTTTVAPVNMAGERTRLDDLTSPVRELAAIVWTEERVTRAASIMGRAALTSPATIDPAKLEAAARVRGPSSSSSSSSPQEGAKCH